MLTVVDGAHHCEHGKTGSQASPDLSSALCWAGDEQDEYIG